MGRVDKVSDVEQLKGIARDVRKDIISMIYNAGSGHPGGSLSAADFLTVLFFNHLNHDPKNPKDEDRDRFILSKGHACPVYYSLLARTGYFGVEELMSFRKLNSRLQGHPDKSKFDLMETTSGSLGQGLSIAAGIAFGLRLDKNDAKVYCLLGDGELDEGQVWESLETIMKYRLNNMIIMIDNNKIQLDGSVIDIKELKNFDHEFIDIGYKVFKIDGHDYDLIIRTYDEAVIASNNGENVIIIFQTIKGKGVSFMENTAVWHGKAPNKEEYELAIKELG
jgi:transketolase